ncbi:hypothetical protein EEB14_31855 [Rhodococcus sp. WS4]|nr:hypothetical protein EEB14_31855 [Rhodococcus sp. WS4]
MTALMPRVLPAASVPLERSTDAETNMTAQLDHWGDRNHTCRPTEGGFVDRDEDSLLVTLAVEWLSFRGPTAEVIWMRFGIHPHQFWHRLTHLLTRRRWHRVLDPGIRAALQNEARTFYSQPEHYPSRLVEESSITANPTERVQEFLVQYDTPQACAAELLCERHPDDKVAFTIVDSERCNDSYCVSKEVDGPS